MSCFFLFLSGCEQAQQTTLRGKGTPKAGRISKAQLWTDLDAFEGYFRTSIEETVHNAIQRDPRTKTSKAGNFFKIRAIQAINTILHQEDPVVAFIEAWGFTARMKLFFQLDGGKSFTGENHPLFVEMADRLESNIETIGSSFMNDDVFEEIRKEINSFARSNPIHAGFTNTIVYATKAQVGRTSPFEEIFGIPMAPITALKGVDRTATSIHHFTDTAARFSDVVQELPESARWQLLALLYDLEEIEMTQEFLTSLSTLSKSSVEISESIKALQKDIPEQTSALIEDIDDKQANLQVTLDKIQDVLVQAEKTSQSFQATAIDVNLTATAWSKAGDSTQKAFSEFTKLKPSTKSAKPKNPINMKDIQNIAETVNLTVCKLSEVMESPQFAEYTLMPKSLINLIAWRLVQLATLVFVLAFIYKIIVCRLIDKKDNK